MTTAVLKRRVFSTLAVVALYTSAAIAKKALTVTVDAFLLSMGIIPDAFGGHILNAFSGAMLLLVAACLMSKRDERFGAGASIQTKDISAAAVIALVAFALSDSGRAFPVTASQLIYELLICGILLPVSEELLLHGAVFRRAVKALPPEAAVVLAATASAAINPDERLFCFAAAVWSGLMLLAGRGIMRACIIRVAMTVVIIMLRSGARENADAARDLIIILILICVVCGIISSLSPVRTGKEKEHER